MKCVAAFLLFLTVSCEIKPAEALQAELPLRSLEVSYDKSFPVSLDPKPAYDYFTGKIYVFGGASVYSVDEEAAVLVDETAALKDGLDPEYEMFPVIKMYFDSDGNGYVLMLKREDGASGVIAAYKRTGADFVYTEFSLTEADGDFGIGDSFIYFDSKLWQRESGSVSAVELRSGEKTSVSVSVSDCWCIDQYGIYDFVPNRLNLYDLKGKKYDSVDLSSNFFYKTYCVKDEPYPDLKVTAMRKFKNYFAFWLGDARSVALVMRDKGFLYDLSICNDDKTITYMKSENEFIVDVYMTTNELIFQYYIIP